MLRLPHVLDVVGQMTKSLEHQSKLVISSHGGWVCQRLQEVLLSLQK
jgi:hypothetical protein